jgi:hypothetical protein
LDVSLIGSFNEFNFRVTTDQNGFRHTTPRALNEKTDPSIILLGDSQMFGVGVDDHDTVASFLSSNSNQVVLNAACPGYSTVEQYQLAQELFKKFSPDYLILAFFSGNDPYENFLHRRSQLRKRVRNNSDVKRVAWLGKLKQGLVRKSAIYNLAIRVRQVKPINDFLYRIGLLNPAKPDELVVFEAGDSVKKSEFWGATEAVLIELSALAKQNGAELVIAQVPDRFQVEETYWDQWVQKYRLDPSEIDLDAPNRHVQAFARKHGIQYLDLTSPLKARQQEHQDAYWRIDNHLSRAGNRIIGRSLSAYLLPRIGARK